MPEQDETRDGGWEQDTRVAPVLRSALLGRCPRCGDGPLFVGFLKIATACRVCGLDFSAIDTGDGPAVFIILIAGLIVTFAALAVEVAFEPPMWVHLALWLPLTLVLTLGMLRPTKALLAVLQYKYKAAPGRLSD